MSIKSSDKILAVNGAIRKAIQKSGGDTVRVSLYVNSNEKLKDSTPILESFKDAAVLSSFETLPTQEQGNIIAHILEQDTDAKQVEKIVYYIEELASRSSH